MRLKSTQNGGPDERADRGAIRQSAAPPCRFAFGDAMAAPLRAWLEGDMREARLSAVFRAYYFVRSLLPLPLRQFLQRRRIPATPPDWYLPLGCLRDVANALSGAGDGIPVIHPWPDGNDLALVLTHDVETADGMRRIGQIADLEEGLGFRSSWNIVPYKYPVDLGLLRELRARGFEIGVHGYNHDGKLFFSRATFNRRARKINEVLRSWGAIGFRAPMVHRNLEWLQSLAIEYDASCFDVDPYQAMPGGVGGVWPFVAGRFVELPYTLPQDHTLLVVLGEPDGRIWHHKLRYVAALRGMALLITHPDYLDTPRRLDVYRRFLEEARELPAAWHALPRDVAAWWRLRDSSALRRDRGGGWHIEGPAASRARVAMLRATTRRDAPHENVLEWGEPVGSPAAPSTAANGPPQKNGRAMANSAANQFTPLRLSR